MLIPKVLQHMPIRSQYVLNKPKASVQPYDTYMNREEIQSDKISTMIPERRLFRLVALRYANTPLVNPLTKS